MEIVFWGVRGSIPSPATNTVIKRKLKALVSGALHEGVHSSADLDRFWRRAPLSDKITFGGNTSCVQVIQGRASLILDAGSGLCPLGRHMTGSGHVGASPCHIFLTHYHWDHIMGFPFFRPAYQRGRRVIIHSLSPHADNYFRFQQSAPFFPAGLEFMPARITFDALKAGQKRSVGPFEVITIQLQHPGHALGFKVTSNGASLVYLTDVELLKATRREYARYRDFVTGVDAAIVDTQYGVLESHEKADWGHSTAFHWIDLMHDRGVKNLFLFHYEPLRNDDDIADILRRARDYLRRLYPESKMQIHASYEGQKVKIGRGAR